MSSFKDDRKSFLINFKLENSRSAVTWVTGNEDISLNNTCIFSNVTLATCQFSNKADSRCCQIFLKFLLESGVG